MEWSVDFLCLICLSLLHGTSAAGQFNLYHAISASFEDAKDYCVTKNRVLAKIDTASKHRKIKNLKPFMEGPFWIGLQGSGPRARNFTWVDSTELDYAKWATGFPGYATGLDCTRMRSDTYEWETFNCSMELNFLCEDPYFKPSSTVSTGTKIQGIFMGIGVIGGLLTLICLLLQLPCCRANVTDKIADLGFGTSDLDQKKIRK